MSETNTENKQQNTATNQRFDVEINTEDEWETLKDHDDYEICKTYPHQIRKKSTERIIKESPVGDGYLRCKLNKKDYYKHRLIALQWIPNPNNLKEIDHMNQNNTDNRIENLRWSTRSENLKNRTSNKGVKYTFYDKLPDTAESLDSYNGHDLDGVYIDYTTEKLYLFNGVKYRELIPLKNKGNIYYTLYSIEDMHISLSHKKLFG